MTTTTELVREVLEELRVAGPSDPISAEDDAKVKAKYEQVRSRLERRFLVDWSSTEEIPNAATEGMTLLVADAVAPAFGKIKDANRVRDGMQILSDYRNTPLYPRPPMRATYY